MDFLRLTKIRSNSDAVKQAIGLFWKKWQHWKWKDTRKFYGKLNQSITYNFFNSFQFLKVVVTFFCHYFNHKYVFNYPIKQSIIVSMTSTKFSSHIFKRAYFLLQVHLPIESNPPKNDNLVSIISMIRWAQLMLEHFFMQKK